MYQLLSVASNVSPLPLLFFVRPLSQSVRPQQNPSSSLVTVQSPLSAPDALGIYDDDARDALVGLDAVQGLFDFRHGCFASDLFWAKWAGKREMERKDGEEEEDDGDEEGGEKRDEEERG